MFKDIIVKIVDLIKIFEKDAYPRKIFCFFENPKFPFNEAYNFIFFNGKILNQLRSIQIGHVVKGG